MSLNIIPLIQRLQHDGSEAAKQQREAILRILIGDDIILRLLNEGGYETFPQEINTENFPTPSEPKLDGAQLERYKTTMSSDDICSELDNRFRRPATVAETLLYSIHNPMDQRKNRIASLGQTWWQRQGESGRPLVVVLDRYESGGFLGHSILNVVKLEPYRTPWGTNYRFLSFPL